MYVVVETYGEELVARELEAVGARGDNMEPLWPAFIRKLEAIQREQFATDGARSGNRWPENNEAYMWSKWQKGYSLETMKATEALYDALTGTTGDSVRNITPTTLEFGADLPQFRIHQDYNPASNFPERTPIDLTEGDARDFAEVMMDYVVGTRNSAGFRIDPSSGRFAGGRNPIR